MMAKKNQREGQTKTQIVILCGGLATRLYPITKKIPKSMVAINGKPFLWHQIQLLKKNGIVELILCISNKGNQIQKYFGDGRKFGVNILYSKDGKRLLGTGGALKMAEPLLGDSFLMMYGDSYLDFNFQKAIRFFEKYNKLGLITVFHNKGNYEPSNVEVNGILIKKYSKKKKTKAMEYIDYGVSIFRKEALKSIPVGECYDLSGLHQVLIRKKQLLAYSAEKRFYQIGNQEGLAEFKEFLKK